MEQVSLQQAVDADPKTAYRALKEPVNLLVAQTSCRFGFISQAVVGRGSFGACVRSGKRRSLRATLRSN